MRLGLGLFLAGVVGMGALAASASSRLEILQPEGGEEKVKLLSKRQLEYLKLPREERIEKFADAGERAQLALDKNEPQPVLVSWRWTGEKGAIAPVFSVELRHVGGGEDRAVRVVDAREPYAFFDNLMIGEKYRVIVSVVVGGRTVARAVRDFETDATAPRLIRVPGVPNVRDIGGRVAMNSRRIRQGLVYRSAGLNNNPEDIDFLTWAECRAEFAAGTLTNRAPWQAKHMAKIYSGSWPSNDWHRVPIANARGRERLSDESRAIMLDTLGIRTDLDLRNDGETVGMSQSPLGDRVKWIHSPSSAYSGFGRPRGMKMTKACLDVFLDESNYPIVFHCIGGQDRTGSLAFIIEAVLGVDDEELYRDWECSGFTNPGNWFCHKDLFLQLYNDVLGRYPGETTREKAEAYFRDCGFTDGDIEKLRRILLEP